MSVYRFQLTRMVWEGIHLIIYFTAVEDALNATHSQINSLNYSISLHVGISFILAGSRLLIYCLNLLDTSRASELYAPTEHTST